MKTTLVCIALSSSLFADAALADESMSPVVAKTDRSTRAHAFTVAGATLLAVGAAATVAATTGGTLGIVGGAGLCGAVNDSCSNPNGANAVSAAIGLGVIAGVTTLVGIPLLIAGHNGSKALKPEPQRFSFGAAPTYSAQQGAGVTAAFGMHF